MRAAVQREAGFIRDSQYACDAWAGYMEGAIRSDLRAAHLLDPAAPTPAGRRTLTNARRFRADPWAWSSDQLPSGKLGVPEPPCEET